MTVISSLCNRKKQLTERQKNVKILKIRTLLPQKNAWFMPRRDTKNTQNSDFPLVVLVGGLYKNKVVLCFKLTDVHGKSRKKTAT